MPVWAVAAISIAAAIGALVALFTVAAGRINREYDESGDEDPEQ